MATKIILGSARHDERYKYTGGEPGDQLQQGVPDIDYGEVAFQDFYIPAKGWYVMRPKSKEVSRLIAESMITACNNQNVGYSQSDRYSILNNGTAYTL